MTTSIETFYSHLAKDIQKHYELAKKPYDIPALPEAQCITIPLIREVIAPLLVRNNDADEITDMVVAGHNRIRIIASKTKGVERRRGAQILRALGMGGWAAANKAFVPKGKKPSDVFDLNSFVFGDSGTGLVSGKEYVFPVHSATLYSDAVSIQPKRNSTHSVFRQGGIYEDGGNFDAEDGKSSSNIFTTYAVNPGTLFVQCLVLPGRRLTRAAFDHLLLSIGLTGSYGGATAVTGTNLRTYCAGIYWGRLERPINAPQEMLKELGDVAESEKAVTALSHAFAKAYPHHIDRAQTDKAIANLITQFENDTPELLAQYAIAKQQVRGLFDAWFEVRTAQEKKKHEGA